MNREELIVALEELLDQIIGGDHEDIDVLSAAVVLHVLCGALLTEDTVSLAVCANAFSAGALERLKRDQAT
jgi:hypothetical protein